MPIAGVMRIGNPVSSPGDECRPMNPVSRAPFAVPRRHESVLFLPRRSEQVAVVDANLQHLREAAVDLHGVSLQTLRAQVKQAVIAQAADYTSSLVGDRVEADKSAPLIVTGHQPELFHAGVWGKNFAAAGLAHQTHGQALNLIVDNDTVSGSRIRVPVGTRQSPAIEWIPFDAAQPQQPWEESTISDGPCFRDFGRRVSSRIRECWNYEPLVAGSWPAAIRHAGVSLRLCDCLAAARVAVERLHGLRNLEVPMSRVCSTLPFCYFATFLLAHLPRFRALYNESVRGYRKAHRLRSSTHPVPELESIDGWFEAPFWVWRRGDHRRERPYARQTGSDLELRDGREIFVRLPITPDRPLDAAASLLAELGNRGIRFRTRALTTTLFARLFLADLFIHGIGGAKYDAMTDQICERFLGIKPPQFVTVSATVHLPLASAFPVTDDDLHTVGQQIRDLRYNPDRHLSEVANSDIQGLIREKGQLIVSLGSARPKKLEHHRLAEINAGLFARLGSINQTLQSDREQLRQQLRANSILQNREFSWCLQPEEVVTAFFRREFLG